MKLRIDSRVFAEAAGFAGKAIPLKPVNAILAGLLIEAAQEQVRLSGFDYEVSSRCAVGAEVLDAGNTLLHGRMLNDILSKLPKNVSVELEVNGNRATITAGKSKYTLPALRVEDFPAMPALPDVVGTVDGDEFARAVSQVAGAAAANDNRVHLMCVELRTNGDSLEFRATDGYRAARQSIAWKPKTKTEYVWMIKAKTIQDAAKLAVGETSILGSAELIGFRSGSRATTSTLVDATYPPALDKMFEVQPATTVTVERDQLADTVNRIGSVIEALKPVRLQISDGEIELDGGNDSDTAGQEYADCVLEGEPVTAGFRPQFLHDALRAFTSDEVVIGFSKPGKPAILSDQTAMRYLLMPINLGATR